MEVWVNPDGTRNKDFRPLINGEGLGDSLYLYDPNGRGFHYGLYDGGQPGCGTWLSNFMQWPGTRPIATVNRDGRMHTLMENVPGPYQWLTKHLRHPAEQ